LGLGRIFFGKFDVKKFAGVKSRDHLDQSINHSEMLSVVPTLRMHGTIFPLSEQDNFTFFTGGWEFFSSPPRPDWL
jgi:hypothetical protein